MGESVGLIAKTPEVKQSNSNSRIQKTARPRSMGTSADSILFLQRTVGNRAVSRLIRSGGLQAKLRIGQPGDVYEQEADRVADAVMRMPELGVQRQEEPEEEEETLQAKSLVEEITQLVQKQVEPEEDDEIEEIQPKSLAGPAPEVTPKMGRDIQSIKGAGQALSASELAFFEPRFGADFSDVRVHNDTQAAHIARSVNARAFTFGRDMVFGAGQYAPESHRGKTLLAHELTHVVQQDSGGWTSARSLPVNKTDEQLIQGSFIGSIKSFIGSIKKWIKKAARAPARSPSSSSIVGSIWKWIKKALGYVWKVVLLFLTPQSHYKPKVTGGSGWELCGRNENLRSKGFKGNISGTYISHIRVDIHPNNYSTVTLTWANSTSESLLTSFNTSPGAGLCTKDCSKEEDSKDDGSYCTPIDNFTVQGYGCKLSSFPSATFVTWFHIDRGIAFHYSKVPEYPASHGCVRLPQEGKAAELIYDNTLPNITSVTVARDASKGPGPKCWSKKKKLVSRSNTR